jgi:ATP synthase protein I
MGEPMNDLHVHLHLVQRIFMLILSFCLVCWALLTEFRPYFAGLILGILVSMMNAKYLAWKIEKLSEPLKSSKKMSRMNIGFLTRASVVALAGLIAIRFEQHFQISTAIIGFFFAHFVSYVIFIVKAFAKEKQ